jgi:hypothetical protein
MTLEDAITAARKNLYETRPPGWGGAYERLAQFHLQLQAIKESIK